MSWPDPDAEASFLWEGAARDGYRQPLAPAEAKQWRRSQPPLRWWRVIFWQLGLCLSVAVGLGLIGRPASAWSFAYGAWAVVLPQWVFFRFTLARGPSTLLRALVRLLLWESVKIVLTAILIALAWRILTEVRGLALLLGVMLAVQVYWMALAVAGARSN